MLRRKRQACGGGDKRHLLVIRPLLLRRLSRAEGGKQFDQEICYNMCCERSRWWLAEIAILLMQILLTQLDNARSGAPAGALPAACLLA